MQTRIWNVLKIFITFAIIAFLFARVDLAQMANQLSRANAGLLLLALALYFSAILIGAIKWLLLVRAQKMTVPLGNLVTYSLVGLFFGNLLPTNVGGDVVRAYGLMRATGNSEGAAVSVLVDRLLGLIAFMGAAVVMAILAVATLTRGAELKQIEIATVFFAALFIAASALMFSERVGQRIKFVFDIGLLAPIRPMAKRVFHALQVYRRSYRALALNFVLSASIVLVTTCVWYTVALALGIRVSLFYFLLFNPLIAFVLLIPISFNGLGPKEATAVFFFGLAGVPSELALAMSLIFHMIVVLTSLPGGALWWRERALAPARNTADG